MSKTAVVIVSYNNQKVLEKAIASLEKQTLLPKKVLIADSGSKDCSYFDSYNKNPRYQAFRAGKEVGFCVANNIAYHLLPKDCKYVLFQNPDCFLSPNFLEEAQKFMDKHLDVGALTGTLKRYDLEKDMPTGKLDSCGVFCTWYGRWYDRGQGKSESKALTFQQKNLEAICGALMFCRKKALDKVMLANGDIFDSSFFMYKEDIDLSIRIKKAGYSLHYEPSLYAFHCRGWQERVKMSRKARFFSAKNEQAIHRKCGFVIPFLYSTCKLFAVKHWNF